MTIEEEDLSTLTGLSEYIVLDTTRDKISMSWQDKIVYQLLHVYESLPFFCHELNTEQKLLCVGFSQKFIDLLRVKVSWEDGFSRGRIARRRTLADAATTIDARGASPPSRVTRTRLRP